MLLILWLTSCISLGRAWKQKSLDNFSLLSLFKSEILKQLKGIEIQQQSMRSRAHLQVQLEMIIDKTFTEIFNQLVESQPQQSPPEQLIGLPVLYQERLRQQHFHWEIKHSNYTIHQRKYTCNKLHLYYTETPIITGNSEIIRLIF